MHPVLSTVLTVLGSALMAVGLGFVLGAMVAMVRVWRNGVPWWSGGMVWFNTALQPPDARPHIRTALRRFALSALFSFAGVMMLAATGEAPVLERAVPQPPARTEGTP